MRERTPLAAEAGAGPERHPFLHYVAVLVERRRVFLAVLAVTFALAVAYNFLALPVYVASTTLEIERNGQRALDFDDGARLDPWGYSYFYETQYRLIQSQGVLARAAERLDLANRPEYLARMRQGESWVRGAARAVVGFFSRRPGLDAETDSGGEAPAPDPSVGYIRRGLRVEPVRTSSLVAISFADPNPRLARDIANAVADAYIEFCLYERSATSEIAERFLTRDAARLEAEIHEKEAELREHLARHGILSVDAGGADVRERELARLHEQWVEARGRLARAEAQAEALRDTPDMEIPEVEASPRIADLRRQEAELERRVAQLEERFKDDWPPLARARNDLATVRGLIEREARDLAEQARTARRIAVAEAAAEARKVERRIRRLEDEVRQVQSSRRAVESLRAEIETKRRLLADRVARQTEAASSGRLRDIPATHIRKVEHAQIPSAPARPRKMQNLFLALVLGACLGGALAFTVHHLDNTVKNEQDLLDASGGAPRLAVIPRFHLREVHSYAPGGHREPPDAGPDPETAPDRLPDLAAARFPLSPFAESFKALRTAILLGAPDEPPRSIVVSSCEPGDGKSTVAINLALSLAQQGRRVLLVDADLRRPRLHKVFDLEPGPGLSSFLSGNAALEDTFLPTGFPDLYCLPSGPLPPNPTELLGTPRLDPLLEGRAGGGRFDHVVLDMPPALPISDALVVGARATGVVLVVRAGKTRRDALGATVERLVQARVGLLGTVLNAVEPLSLAARYAYRYRYAYGYPPVSQAGDAARTAGRPPSA